MIAVVTCGHPPDDERIYGREIRSLLSAGRKITFFTRWAGSSFLSKENLWHRNYSESDLSVRDYTKGILNDFKVLKPTVVHIHEFELLPLAKKARKLYNSKIVYDVHEANIELWDAFSSKQKTVKQIINKSLNRFEKSYLKYVDCVLTTTPELVRRYQDRGVNSYFIPNYPIDFPRRRKKTEIPTIIYHGQISIERGMEDLINAVVRLDINVSPFKLLIYGEERTTGTIEHLNKLIHSLGLGGVVEIHNQIAHKEILKILSSAHIAVIPFRDYPMFQIAIPVKMFEAMWAGCAIIASDLKAFREHDAEHIKFYPAGDVSALFAELKKLLVNSDERERMGRIGTNLIREEYNWKKIEPILLQAYEKV